MANLKVNTVSGIGTEGTVFDGGLKFRSKNYMTLPKGNTTDAFPDFKAVPAASARGIFAGGISEPSPTRHNEIDYITIATTGNATDFGDLSLSRKFIASSGDSTRGLFMGGETPTQKSVIDYVTISSGGGANDFGDLTEAKDFGVACNSSVRGIYGGGQTADYKSDIEFVIIQSTGQANKFGDLTQARLGLGAGSSPTRAVFGLSLIHI